MILHAQYLNKFIYSKWFFPLGYFDILEVQLMSVADK